MKKSFAIPTLFLGIFLLVTPLPAAAAPLPAGPPSAGARLHDLFDRDWNWRLEESPLFATSVGVHDYDDRLGDASAAAEARRAKSVEGFLAELRAIPKDGLSNEDRIDAEIFERQLEHFVGSVRFKEYEIPSRRTGDSTRRSRACRRRCRSRQYTNTRTTSRG